MPAQAGIHGTGYMDTGLRRHDELFRVFPGEGNIPADMVADID
jgi:hypothetical protein